MNKEIHDLFMETSSYIEIFYIEFNKKIFPGMFISNSH